MIIDCIADLHGFYPKLEGGDLLIVAGDLTADDTVSSWKKYYDWLSVQSYSRIIYIAGNHDNFLMHAIDSSKADHVGLDRGEPKMEYLCDSGTEFEGLKIWGSPWTLTFPGINPRCTAFTGTEEELKAKFDLIPDDIDILITHGPPYGVLDLVDDPNSCANYHVGSRSLGVKIRDSNIKYNIFGPIHEGYGHEELERIRDEHLFNFVNCSHVNERYQPVNKPISIIL
jgi:Icc-related predicted phosphoesterase